MEVRFRVTRVRVVVLAAIVAAVAASVAWAASPGDGGVVQGCYDSGGNVKVVAALPCPRGYTALQWNVQGVKGDKGDKGDQGDKGIQGVKGDKGDQGIQGIQGIQGPKGDQGPPGGAGASGYEVVVQQDGTFGGGLWQKMTPSERHNFLVPCPPGKVAVGGGYAALTDVVETGDAPWDPAANTSSSGQQLGGGWWVALYNTSGSDTGVRAYAICVNA